MYNKIKTFYQTEYNSILDKLLETEKPKREETQKALIKAYIDKTGGDDELENEITKFMNKHVHIYENMILGLYDGTYLDRKTNREKAEKFLRAVYR